MNTNFITHNKLNGNKGISLYFKLVKHLNVTYPEFENDIKTSFEKVVIKYALKLVNDPSNKDWFVLTNGSTVISFSFDRGEIYCCLSIGKDYFDIAEFANFKKIVFPKDQSIWNPKHILSFYSQVFLDYELEEIKTFYNTK